METDEFPDAQISFPVSSSIDIKRVESFVLNDDDDTDDGKSSTDTIIATKEIQKIFDENSSQTLTYLHLPIENLIPEEKSTPITIPRSVYQYATQIHETFESPRQNKLEQDVTTILGSSDPPAGSDCSSIAS